MLESALAILLVAVLVVSLAPRLRFSPVVGYLVAGALIGPGVLGIVHEPESVALLAELGIVFLLFGIGLELSFERLKALRGLVFGLGSLQVLVTGLAIALLARLAGLSWGAATVLGGALALSSTAVVLQLLQERGESASRFALVAFAVLLLQDLAVLPLLALVRPLAGGGEGLLGELALDVGRAVVAVAVTLLAGRYVMRPLYRHVAGGGHRELLVATALLAVLGAGYAMSLAGLSMALGALLAGVLLSGSEYRHQVEADLRPFRGLFLGLFFLYVGMTADLGTIVTAWPWVIGGALLLMAMKALLVFLLCRLVGQPSDVALSVAGFLAPGGEFAFVLLAAAAAAGVVPAGLASVTMAVVVLTLLLAPFAAALGRRAAQVWVARRGAAESPPAEPGGEPGSLVLIAGFGRVGQTVAGLATAQGLAYVALDLDPVRVDAARRRSEAVYFGDASRIDVLQAAGAGRAGAVVVTLDDAEEALRCVAALRHAYPALPLFARARDLPHAGRLLRAGATAAVPEAVEGSLQLGASLLAGLQRDPAEIEALLARLRAEGYAELRGSGDGRS